MKNANLRKTHLFEAQQAVCQIINPVIESSKIDCFGYWRIYQTNQAVVLTTFPEVVETVMNQHLCSNYDLINAIISHRKGIHCLDNHVYYLTEKESLKAYQLVRSFGLYNSLVLVDKRDDFFECFCFSSHIADDITDYYFDHWDGLVKLKHLFLDKGQPLIDKACQEKLIIDSTNHSERKSQSERFFSEIPLDSYFLLYHNQQIKISQRELDCLKLLAGSKSYKKIADILGIPEQTATSYIESLQDKLQVHHLSELIGVYRSSDLRFL